MDEKQATIQSFCNITGLTPDKAKSYLEASNWDINEATALYFDSPQQKTSTESMNSSQSTTTSQSSSASTSSKQPTKVPKTKPSESKMKTLADIKKDDEDDNDRERYYAGGEKSGIQIQDPNAKRTDPKDIVSNVFEAAKKHGAKPPTERESTQKEKFTGVGYRLGNTMGASYPDPQTLVRKTKTEPIVKTIKFWKNGFQVGDDGPLRSYTDPQNIAFLEDIHKGVIPRELEAEIGPGRELHVNLVDQKHEEWKEPPKPKIVPFSGTGYTLGRESTTSSTSLSSTTSTSTSTPPPTTTTTTMIPTASIDESQPTTPIQIRLYDGTRLVAKFNHNSTIGDIRNFVNHAKVLPPGKSYDLMTSYPPKVLTDLNQTIRDAGLINAVIVQKLK